jgi:protein O-mannosyl-transferase
MSTGGSAQREDRRRVAGICGLLALAVFGVFGQTLRHGFVNFDDDKYVLGNPEVANGLTLSGVGWAFTHSYANNWHPVTWLSHMLDCQLYGLNPGGHHLTNVLLHAAAAVLLFLVLRRMTAALWPSAFVAAVFAVHPLRVESVAWVAERKDVLCAVFFMLTLLMYTRFVEQSAACGSGSNSDKSRAGVQGPKPKVFYGFAVLFFALGLMSKPMLVTLPFVLLLLDYWPLRRLDFSLRTSRPSTLRPLILEKLPFFAMSVGSAVVTVLAQRQAVATLEWLPFSQRLGNALVACATYLGQMCYPAGLAIFYPHPAGGLPSWQVGFALLLLTGISAGVLVRWRQSPYLTVGWLWYLGMLVPVIGLLQVGEQARADRYTYLPQIGIGIAVAWGARDLFAASRYSRRLPGMLAGALIAGLMSVAFVQTSHWRNTESLWQHAIACTSKNYVAQNNLGLALSAEGRFAAAIGHFQKAVEFKPDYAEAHNNLSLSLAAQGRSADAVEHFQRALALKPDYVDAHNNLGILLVSQDRPAEAMEHFQRALELEPDLASTHNNLGLLLAMQSRLAEAMGHYEKALAVQPGYAEAHHNLAVLLAAQNRPAEAIAHWELALRSRPDYVQAHYFLGFALAGQGRVGEAIGHWEQALRIKPDYAEAHYNLGVALVGQGRVPEAIAHWEQAVRIQPNYAQAHNNLGIAMEETGEIGKAIEHWNRVLQIQPGFPGVRQRMNLALQRQDRLDAAATNNTQTLPSAPAGLVAPGAGP